MSDDGNVVSITSLAGVRPVGSSIAYAMTKALGERALTEERGDIPVSIVRPSIIESALVEPRPGWIRGFRMAEPVIISYARGLLKQFPGVPEGVVDVIPVDLVVGAICGVAARGPVNEDGSPDITQVASGTANPLGYQRLVDLVQSWFTEHPLYDSKGQPINVPEFAFPGRGKVQGQLRRARDVMDRAENYDTLELAMARARDILFDQDVETADGVRGRASGIADDGSLNLQTADGMRAIHTATIRLADSRAYPGART